MSFFEKKFGIKNALIQYQRDFDKISTILEY